MPLCFVSIGSNIDRERNVRGAIAALRNRFGPLLISMVYETPAVGFAGDPFYNLVVAFFTDTSIEQVREFLVATEDAHGRTRGQQRFSPRTLDLDILLYGELVRHDDIDVPRSEIAEQGFVLEPLSEIAPDLAHPSTGATYADMWRRTAATGGAGNRVAVELTWSDAQ